VVSAFNARLTRSRGGNDDETDAKAPGTCASACLRLVWPRGRREDIARDGFYGGIALRDATGEQGVAIRDASNPWTRLAPVAAEGQASQALVYGGYRWRRDLALEAALGSESYRLPGRVVSASCCRSTTTTRAVVGMSTFR